MKPFAVDLFCGHGGWTIGFLEAGFRVTGYDIHRFKDYPGRFVEADVRDLRGSELGDPVAIVASPPCNGFSVGRFANPQRRHTDSKYDPWKRPNPADLELVLHTLRVIREAAPRYWVVENVRGALGWFEPMMGPPRFSNKPWYLWGTFPGFLLRKDTLEHKSKFRSAALRAKIPGDLARPLARAIAEDLRVPRKAPVARPPPEPGGSRTA